MNSPYTSMGGAGAAFPRTNWGMLTRLDRTQERQEGFEALLGAYWKPVYVYIRAAWSKSNEDAKDLTQAFFVWLMEGDALGKYDSQRGSFRRFLKILLNNFLGEHERALRRLKRGGGIQTVRLEDPEARGDDLPDDRNLNPQQIFDRQWTATVARRAIDKVRKQMAQDHHEDRFRAYETYDLRAAEEKPTYSAIARQLGMTEPEVRHALKEVRDRVRTAILDELRSTSATEADLAEEWNALFQS